MEIKNSTITFWFQKQPNPKNFVDTFNNNLKDYFFEFNIIGVPANIDPTIPRLTAVSSSNHSNIEISMINAQLKTNFDNNYSKDIKMCINYLKERALKLYDTLKEFNINIIYSAIFINLEEKETNAVEKIKNQFLKKNDLDKIDEIGIRFSQVIDNKFYGNISFNNSKQIKIENICNKGEIIFPLISLNDASEIENFLSVSVEFNDKFAFNSNSNNNTKKEDLLKLFNLMSIKLEEEMKRFK